MKSHEFLDISPGRRIAYHKTDGAGPGILFLSGFMSDMEGTKAIWLENWARKQGRAFVRFDYCGHGVSSGAFTEGTIGSWAEDAACILTDICAGPQILVGSSMGGWISLLLAKRFPDLVRGLVGIAAAPDFTEDSMWAGFSAQERKELDEKGVVSLPSDYGEPYPITRGLIENGRENLVLRDDVDLPFPARFLQGTDDTAVSQSVALKVLEMARGPDIRLTLVKGADHRFSSPECLELITAAIDEVS